jgi:hypothetical protein
METWDILKRLEQFDVLPERMTTKSQELKPAGGLMDYAEKIANNTKFWNSLPNDLPNTIDGSALHTTQDLKSWLEQIIDESR